METSQISISELIKRIYAASPKTLCTLSLELKWGLTLLGEERAKEYLAWLEARCQQKE
jgi:hypothetical protein